MTTTPAPPTFAVIGGDQVAATLAGQEPAVLALVQATYLLHEDGGTVNPPSSFLRFPGRPRDRIIALPASIATGDPVDGIKWIASVPDNLARGLPRASAVTILNDPVSGHPYACLESSTISAVRTAASAALAARVLLAGRGGAVRVGVLGGGVIARHVHHYLLAAGVPVAAVGVHDLDAGRADGFAAHVRATAPGTPVAVHGAAEGLVRSSDLLVLTTVAPEPYLTDPAWFAHHPVVLNVSLRDLSADVVLGSANVVDDVEHVLKAGTSVHLAAQRTGDRSFVTGTLAQVLRDEVHVPVDRTVVFSPFGLGVLDLALAKHVHDSLRDSGRLTAVPGFFGTPGPAGA